MIIYSAKLFLIAVNLSKKRLSSHLIIHPTFPAAFSLLAKLLYNYMPIFKKRRRRRERIRRKESLKRERN